MRGPILKIKVDATEERELKLSFALHIHTCAHSPPPPRHTAHPTQVLTPVTQAQEEQVRHGHGGSDAVPRILRKPLPHTRGPPGNKAHVRTVRTEAAGEDGLRATTSLGVSAFSDYF